MSEEPKACAVPIEEQLASALKRLRQTEQVLSDAGFIYNGAAWLDRSESTRVPRSLLNNAAEMIDEHRYDYIKQDINLADSMMVHAMDSLTTRLRALATPSTPDAGVGK